MSKRKSIALILLTLLLSLLIAIIFIVLSVIFVSLTNYNPANNHFVINILVWGVEFVISYFIIIGLTWLINKKTKIINKWIMYFSLLIVAIFISFLPGGFESIYITSFFGVISFIELIQIAIKNRDIKIFNDNDEKNDLEK